MKPGKFPRHGASTPRNTATNILLNVWQKSRDRTSPTAQELLNRTLPQFTDRRDAGLCTELVYGTLRQWIKLDWLVNRQLARPDKLPPALRVILLSATYELLYLDRIPAHATVNLAVESVRASMPGLARLANGVLRSLARLGAAPRSGAWYAEQISDPLERTAVEHSVPIWIIRLWNDAYSLNVATELAQASSQAPWPALRLNRTREDWPEVHTQLKAQGGQPTGASGICFAPSQTPDHIPTLVAAGQASWQGAGTQSILEALGAQDWTGPIWDACAGRGGKSCALLEMGNDVRLASDPHSRIRSLPDEISRLGLPAPEWQQARAQDVSPGFAAATILLDVPCSGLGTMARRPDVRLNRLPEDIPQLAATQAEIIATAWNRLLQDGRLVYITCTVTPEENEDQIRRLLQQYGSAILEKECRTPGLHGADIMYGAVIRKG